MRKRYLLWLGLAFTAASCVQILDAAYDYQPKCTDGLNCTTNETCNADANCDDKNPCTVNLCGPNKTCEFNAIDDGIAPVQAAGDCQQATCSNGAVGQMPDDMDVPDDMESCTTDSCSNGVPKHDVLPDESSCTLGNAAGLCKAGKCFVECSADKPCNDGNPCTEDTCNASTGACSFVELDGLPTPGFTPIVGDCSQQICVNGVDTAIADDADKPNDNNVCTQDDCINGKPVQTPVNAGAPCMTANGTGVCDNAGNCIECNAPEDCPGSVNPCKQRSCTNNKCGFTDLVGQEVSVVPGDCHKFICDATGMPVDQINNTDLPDDGNPCTKDICTNGVPSHANEANGAMLCGGTLTCNGMGQCAGCTTAADCGTSDNCKTYSCTANKCNIAYKANGTAVPEQTAGDCKVNVCDGAGKTITAIDASDLPNDNIDCTLDTCTANGTPTNTLAPLDTPCMQNGGTACNGLGACLVASGGSCSDAMQCVTGFCIDGVCCNSTCTSQCMACNVVGLAGTCSNVPANSDDSPLCIGTNSCDGMGNCKRDNGQACGANADCLSGFCADGVCCNSACNETCKSCNLTGIVGTCTFVPYDTIDPTGTMTCVNPYRCDGTGLCKALNSVVCSQSSECFSGYCVDGYCCNNVCNGLCKACSGALTGGNNGTCSNILNGTDPQNECPTGDCNGNGQCSGGTGGLANGASCTAAGQCTSGFCIDGVCCNTGCTESCKACNRSGSVGTCTNVPNDTFDPTGATPCVAPYKCDGNGVCKGLNSVACTAPTQCLSGYCVDGFCCNGPCTNLCYSCASTLNAGADGTCSPTKAGIDPDNECPTGNCNGAGQCTP